LIGRLATKRATRPGKKALRIRPSSPGSAKIPSPAACLSPAAGRATMVEKSPATPRQRRWGGGGGVLEALRGPPRCLGRGWQLPTGAPGGGGRAGRTLPGRGRLLLGAHVTGCSAALTQDLPLICIASKEFGDFTFIPARASLHQDGSSSKHGPNPAEPTPSRCIPAAARFGRVGFALPNQTPGAPKRPAALATAIGALNCPRSALLWRKTSA
jgi:hypothetical protein